MFIICLYGHVKCQVKGDTLLTCPSTVHSGASTRTPCSSGTQSDGSPLSCLLRGNGETMGSPPEGWPVFAARVFVLHRVFTQNTSAPLRTRSAHPSNLLRRQRQSVPQNNTSPKVTLWPHTGSCCQPCLTEAQRQCPAKEEASTRTEQCVHSVRPQVVLSVNGHLLQVPQRWCIARRGRDARIIHSKLKGDHGELYRIHILHTFIITKEMNHNIAPYKN